MSSKTSRRAVLLAAPALILAGCQARQPLGPVMPADQAADPARPLTLVYLGARNCGYCLDWEGDEELAFLASAERREITYRRLIFASFRDLTSDQVWPADLVWIRDELGITGGTPQYVIVRGREVLLSAIGTDEWDGYVLPTLRGRLRAERE